LLSNEIQNVKRKRRKIYKDNINKKLKSINSKKILVKMIILEKNKENNVLPKKLKLTKNKDNVFFINYFGIIIYNALDL